MQLDVRIKEIIEVLGSSTRPLRAKLMSGADVVLKVKENPEGPNALSRDLIMTRLAQAFGLSTFSLNVLKIQPDDADLINESLKEKGVKYDAPVSAGHALCSAYEDGGPWNGTEDQIKGIANTEDIAKLVLFDTWIRNRDRRAPKGGRKGGRKPNLGNVWLSLQENRQIKLKAIDHTHCLGKVVFKKLTDITEIRDKGVFSYFEYWRQYVTAKRIGEELGVLAALIKDAHCIDAAIQEVPSDWDLSDGDRQGIGAFLRDRGCWIVENFPRAVSASGFRVSEDDEVDL